MYCHTSSKSVKMQKKRIPKDTHFFKLFQNSKEFPHTRGFAFVL